MHTNALPLLVALSLTLPATALAGGRGGHPAAPHHAAPRPQVHHPAPRVAVQHHSAPRPPAHHPAPRPQVHHNPAPKPQAHPKPPAPKPQAHHNAAPKAQAHPKPSTATAAKPPAKPKDQPHNKPTSRPQHSTPTTKLAKANAAPAATTTTTSPSIFSPVPTPSQNIFGPVPNPSQNLFGPVPTLKTSSGRPVAVRQAVSGGTTRNTSVNRTAAARTGLVGVGSPGLGYGYNPWAAHRRGRSYRHSSGYNRYRRGYYRPRRYYVVRRNYAPTNATNAATDPALQRLRADLESIPLGATTTKAMTARLTTDLQGVVQGPIQPPEAPVQALAANLAEGVARRTSQGINGLSLARSLKVAMNGAFLPRSEVSQAIGLGQRALRGFGVPSAEIGFITRQLRIIALDAPPNHGLETAPAAVAAAPPAAS